MLPRWLPLAAALACSRTAPAPATVTTRFVRVPDASTTAILLTSNNVDLAYARLAAARATDRDVKSFARRMTVEHSAWNARLNRLVNEYDLTPREDQVSRMLREQSEARRDTLQALTGWQFDSAYVANEVRYHRELLTAIDQALLPSARRIVLREYVTAVRPGIAAHLAHAEQLQHAMLTAPPARR